jgi:hypothetical protein
LSKVFEDKTARVCELNGSMQRPLLSCKEARRHAIGRPHELRESANLGSTLNSAMDEQLDAAGYPKTVLRESAKPLNAALAAWPMCCVDRLNGMTLQLRLKPPLFSMRFFRIKPLG